MNFFASDPFLTALARDYHRAEKFEFKLYRVQREYVRLAEINGRRVLKTGPFYDYVKPVSLDGAVPGTISYLPKLVTSTIALDAEKPAESVPVTDREPAPLIRWEGFATWDEYLAMVGKRSGNQLDNRHRKLKRMVREQGEPVFTFDDPDPVALDLCVTWKSKQYEGGHETLEDPAALAMLRGLFRDGHLILSTLKVAGRHVAVQAGFIWQGEYLYLIPAYDPEFARHGVGRELLLRTLEYSFRQGHKSFDLLQGAEPYKWNFATHVQLIESVGTPPLIDRSRATLERVAKKQLRALSPELFYRVKRGVLAGRRRVKDTTERLHRRKQT